MSSREVSINDFGLVIAYLLPGLLALWGTTYLTDTLRPWFGSPPTNMPTIGGFLYVTLASIAAGMTVSTVRWLLLDTFHHRTGIPPPRSDFAHLKESVAAFGVLVDIHYRYYQWNANSLIALVFVYFARRWSQGIWSMPVGWTDLGFLLLALVLFLGSRDSLAKYYLRTGQLLQERRSRAAMGEPH